MFLTFIRHQEECWMDVWSGYHLSRSFQYYVMQQKERKNKQKQSKYVDQPKKIRFYGACKLHYEKKKYYKRRSHPQPSYTQFLLHRKFFLTKALSLRRSSEPLKRPLSAVQEPPAPFLLSVACPLSLHEFSSLASTRRRPRKKQATWVLLP